MSLMNRLPIFWLTLRQFAAGKAIRVVTLFALTPVVFALIYLISSQGVTSTRFLSDTFLNLLAPTVVPLATLILATAALGNEVADRTIAYVVLKPISRWRIVLEKFAGTAVVTGLAFVVGVVATWAIANVQSPASTHLLLALLVGVLAGIVSYGAVFMLVSLVISRALVVGIIYILLWESLLARFIPGIKFLSVRHFTQSIFVHLVNDSAITLDRAAAEQSAFIVLGLVAVASLVLATVRLRRMNLD